MALMKGNVWQFVFDEVMALMTVYIRKKSFFDEGMTLMTANVRK